MNIIAAAVSRSSHASLGQHINAETHDLHKYAGMQERTLSSRLWSICSPLWVTHNLLPLLILQRDLLLMLWVYTFQHRCPTFHASTGEHQLAAPHILPGDSYGIQSTPACFDSCMEECNGIQHADVYLSCKSYLIHCLGQAFFPSLFQTLTLLRLHSVRQSHSFIISLFERRHYEEFRGRVSAVAYD